VLYVDRWHHCPLTPGAARSAALLVEDLLRSVGVDPLTGGALEGGPVALAGHGTYLSAPAATDTTTNGTATGAGTGGSGLSQETFVAFALLHLVGHKDVVVPPGALAWAATTACTAHGLPPQAVAFAALVCSYTTHYVLILFLFTLCTSPYAMPLFRSHR
jgi:hypothetical protein